MHGGVAGRTAIHRPLIGLPDISEHSAPDMCASRTERTISPEAPAAEQSARSTAQDIS